MTKQKQEWANLIKAKLPTYLLSDTIKQVSEYLWAPVTGVELGSYAFDYGSEIEKELRSIYRKLDELRVKIKEKEKQELVTMAKR